MERHLGIPKKRVIRAESEETQDYVRESLNLSREVAEEVSFVPSAISIPQRPMFWCDNRCSDKESYTANLCQQCYNESLTAKGLAHLKNWQWTAVVEKKAHRGRLWGKTSLYKESGNTFRLKE